MIQLVMIGEELSWQLIPPPRYPAVLPVMIQLVMVGEEFQ
jgi:hypothetical protein